MTDLGITAHCDDDTVHLLIAGEIDMDNADQIPAAVAGALRDQPAHVVVDLAGVTFLDSSGLWQLITAQRMAGDSGCDLRVLNARGGPLWALRMTGLLDILSPRDQDGRH